MYFAGVSVAQKVVIAMYIALQLETVFLVPVVLSAIFEAGNDAVLHNGYHSRTILMIQL